MNPWGDNKEYVIYGAGPIGELTLRALQNRGCERIRFCDENPSKRETHYLGYPVISPSTLAESWRHATVLVTPMREFRQAEQSLRAKGLMVVQDVKTLISEVDIQGETWQLNSPEYLEYCRSIYFKELDRGEEGIVLRYLDLPVTQCCTLLCRDCSNLMQYFSKPIHYDLGRLLDAFDQLEACVDEIVNLTVLGGEPLMYRELPILLKRLAQSRKIGQILLFTNGTLLPDAETLEAMKAGKVLTQISDYGTLSPKIQELMDVLDETGLAYSRVCHNSWNDFGGLDCRNRSVSESRAVFERCRGKRTLSYVDGKLFHCVRASHRYLLGVSEQQEFVDVASPAVGREQKRDELRRLLDGELYPASCNYCNGFDEDSPTVPAAEQGRRCLEIED